MTKVDVYYYHNGERWYGARFRVPKHEIPLQVWAPTEKELAERLGIILNFEFGLGEYSINETENDIA